MTWWRRWCVQVGLWLARLGGWTPPAPVTLTLPAPPLVEASVMAVARQVIAEVERQHFTNGEQKRHAALRAMLNHFPARARDCGLAIELAVRDRD